MLRFLFTNKEIQLAIKKGKRELIDTGSDKHGAKEIIKRIPETATILKGKVGHRVR